MQALLLQNITNKTSKYKALRVTERSCLIGRICIPLRVSNRHTVASLLIPLPPKNSEAAVKSPEIAQASNGMLIIACIPELRLKVQQ